MTDQTDDPTTTEPDATDEPTEDASATVTVPTGRDELGRHRGAVKATDPIAAQDWDARLWRSGRGGR